MKTKICYMFGEEKPNTIEYFHKKRNALNSRCKVCQSEKAKIRYKNDVNKYNIKKERIEDLDGEVWKYIKGYEGLYQVSNLGKIKSLGNNKFKKEKILKTCKNRYGYVLVPLNLNANKKFKSVHRLVAQAFISNPNNLPEVNHKDETRDNNNVSNLGWCDRKYNLDYGTGNKRRSEKLSQKVYQYNLKKELIKVWDSTIQCKEKGYSIGNISLCCNGKRNKHKNSIWSYRPL